MNPLLSDILAQALGFLPKKKLTAPIPDAIYQEALKQTVLLLVLSIAPNPKYEMQKLQIMRQNMLVSAEHAALTKILSKPFTTIKGYASAYYYPEPALRMLGDVDFWVSDVKASEKDLLAQGFPVVEDDGCDHHYHFTKDDIHYELHWTANGILTRSIGKLLQDTIATSKKVSSPFGEIIIPDAFHHGLIMLLHMLHHLTESQGMGLRHLCDWAVFVHKLGADFPELFETKLKQVELWQAARAFSLLSVRALHLPYQPWMGEIPAEKIEPLLQDIMKTGNHGKWDKTNRERFLANHTPLQAANAVTRSHWPLARSCPLLLPFGWVYFGCRYLILTLLGKRQNILSAHRGAALRQELYSVFALPKQEQKGI